MKLTVIGWCVFFGGNAALMAADALLRLRQGSFGQSGSALPDVVLVPAVLVLALIAIVLLWRGTIQFRRPWVRFILVGLEVAVAFCLRSFAWLVYVIETGIDSL